MSNQPRPPAGYLTLNQVAARMEVSYHCAQSLVYRGLLPARREGLFWLVSGVDLERFLATPPPTPEPAFDLYLKEKLLDLNLQQRARFLLAVARRGGWGSWRSRMRPETRWKEKQRHDLL